MFKRFWWIFLVMLPVGALVGLLLASIVTYVMPKMYESEVTIEVKPQMKSPVDTMNPQFFATEFEVMKSRDSLQKVVENLELVTRWNLDKESAVQVVKNAVTAVNIRGTDLVSMRVRHTNKVDARDIAAEVARVYKEYRAESEGRGAERRFHELQKVLREQEDKVEARRKVLSSIKRTEGVGGLLSPENDGVPKKLEQVEDTSREEAIQRGLDAQDYVDAKREFETDMELLKTLKIKLMEETIALKTPSAGVVIHDEPVISDAPISPNVSLNLVLGTALGLLFSPLMALPVMWVLNRLKPVRA